MIFRRALCAATLLQALLRLIETQAGSLTVEDEHQVLGQITLSSI